MTVDNESYDDRTVITVDSANRPGTLVEVVQCLTELGLNVKRARISSDGGWFVDEFHVCEQQVRSMLGQHQQQGASRVAAQLAQGTAAAAAAAAYQTQQLQCCMPQWALFVYLQQEHS